MSPLLLWTIVVEYLIGALLMILVLPQQVREYRSSRGTLGWVPLALMGITIPLTSVIVSLFVIRICRVFNECSSMNWGTFIAILSGTAVMLVGFAFFIIYKVPGVKGPLKEQ